MPARVDRELHTIGSAPSSSAHLVARTRNFYL